MAHILKGNGLTRIVIIMLSAVVVVVVNRQVSGILKINKDKECHSRFLKMIVERAFNYLGRLKFGFQTA